MYNHINAMYLNFKDLSSVPWWKVGHFGGRSPAGGYFANAQMR